MKRTRVINLRGPRYLWGIALAAGWAATAMGCAGSELQLAQPHTPTTKAEPAAPAVTPPKQAAGPYGIDDWWPNQLDLRPLKANALKSDPTDPTFDYRAAFLKLDLGVVKKDIEKVLTTSQDWWPADYGTLRRF
jgi:catalase-peroxidase